MSVTLAVVLWVLLVVLVTVAMIALEGFHNKHSGKCFFHTTVNRRVAEDGYYEYYECPKCKIRSAVRMDGGNDAPSANIEWLQGGPWKKSNPVK